VGQGQGRYKVKAWPRSRVKIAIAAGGRIHIDVWASKYHHLVLIHDAGMLMRSVKCEAKAESRYHKAEAEAKAKKLCDTEAELCEAEARDAVLTINY